MTGSSEFAHMDDSALLGWRATARAELEQLQPASLEHAVLAARYDRSTEEINDRARKAWAGTS